MQIARIRLLREADRATTSAIVVKYMYIGPRVIIFRVDERVWHRGYMCDVRIPVLAAPKARKFRTLGQPRERALARDYVKASRYLYP